MAPRWPLSGPSDYGLGGSSVSMGSVMLGPRPPLMSAAGLETADFTIVFSGETLGTCVWAHGGHASGVARSGVAFFFGVPDPHGPRGFHGPQGGLD
eukprot:9255396-Pyramimonas_sp.AAC.1